MFVVDYNLHDLGCGSAGYGNFGTHSYTDVELTAGFVTLFCFNGFDANPDNRLGWVFHEFLHGFGKGTSHTEVLLSPVNGVYEPYFYTDPTENLLAPEYAERSGPSYMDVMAWTSAGAALNSIVRYQYGWLKETNVEVVHQGTGSQTYDLHPVDSLSLYDGMKYMIQLPIHNLDKPEPNRIFDQVHKDYTIS